MKTHVCQNCGAIVRRLGCKCSSCGNVVTTHSYTEVLELFPVGAPNTVAPVSDPLLAENMICKLHHDASLSRGKADCPVNLGKNSGKAGLSLAVTSCAGEIGNSFKTAATVLKEAASEAEQSTAARDVQRKVKQDQAACQHDYQ